VRSLPSELKPAKAGVAVRIKQLCATLKVQSVWSSALRVDHVNIADEPGEFYLPGLRRARLISEQLAKIIAGRAGPGLRRASAAETDQRRSEGREAQKPERNYGN